MENLTTTVYTNNFLTWHKKSMDTELKWNLAQVTSKMKHVSHINKNTKETLTYSCKPNRLSKQSVTDTKTWNCIEHERNEEIKERIRIVTKKTVYSSKVEHTYNNIWAMQLAVSST